MDQPASYEDLHACLRSLAQVNRLTGAYRPTLHWLDRLYASLPGQTAPLHVVDVGCGYGDTLRRIHRWARQRRMPVRLTGIDLNPDAIRAAREATQPGTVTFLEGDAFTLPREPGIDVVVTSLVMHHLESPAIVDLLRWMERTARLGWFINDLHRQPVPYHLFRALSHLMRWHRFVRHDGPVSILRSFRPEDWRSLLAQASLPAGAVEIREHRPARLCVARLR